MTDELTYARASWLHDPAYRAALDAVASVAIDHAIGLATDADLDAAEARLRAERARVAEDWRRPGKAETKW